MIGKNLEKERIEARKTLRHLREVEGDILLDCGANVGFVAEGVRNQFKRIYAVEAHPTTAARLQRRVRKIDNIVPIFATVYGVQPSLDLFISSPGNSTGAIVTTKKRKKIPGWYAKAGPPISLDTLLDQTKADVVKLDIEGCEYEAILNSDLHDVNHLIVEYHNTRGAKGYKLFQECDLKMRKLGFKRTFPKKEALRKLPDGSALKTLYFVAAYRRKT